MYNINFYNNYLFFENSDFSNFKIKNLKKISIIYQQSPLNINCDEIKKLHLWCKKKKIKFYITDNYKLAVKYKANGIYLTAKNKGTIFSKFFKSNFEIIGSAHNQIEHFFKIRQNSKLIMLSPIFYNPKYSSNKILGIQKFNLISKNWTKKICALGGVNFNNVKKIQCTRAKSIAYKRAIKNPPTL